MNRIEEANLSDAAAVLELQKLCYQSEAELYNDFTLPPLAQSLAEIEAEFDNKVFFKLPRKDNIIASVRGFLADGTCHIERLIVHPEVQGQGLDTSLLKHIEAHFGSAERFELFTGSKSSGNLRLYERSGYGRTRTTVLSDKVTIVFLEKVSKDG